MELFGYLIVKRLGTHREELEKIYKRFSCIHHNNLRLNELFDSMVEKVYRGIDRDVLLGFDEDDFTENSSKEFLNTKDARVKMNDILQSKNDDAISNFQYPDDENCFNELKDALEVYKLLSDQSKYEIIKIRRKVFEKRKQTLGFDVGYWGDGNFSTIWNGLYAISILNLNKKESYEAKALLEKLNENLLFNLEKDAINFRNWYINQPWAEEDIPYDHEESGFSIIQVDEVIH